MEFLITGLRSNEDRKSKNIKLSTLLDPSVYHERPTQLSQAFCSAAASPAATAAPTAETEARRGEWIEFPVVHFLSDEFQ